MRIVTGSAVCPLLRARQWVKRGRIWRALRPLLGNGLILAEGEEHIRQRRQIGDALRKIPQDAIDAAVEAFEFPPIGARVNLAHLMMQLTEHVMRRVLFGVDGGEGVGDAIRSWLRWMPLQLLGLPMGWRHLRRLDAALAAIPRPAWMPADLSPREVRDQLATLYVASVETTAADLTWRLAGRPNTPIWFVPRQHAETGEDVVCLLSLADKFGAGPRRCIGEQLAQQVGDAVVRKLTQTMRWQPLRLDLRPRFGLTRWPKLAIVERVG